MSALAMIGVLVLLAACQSAPKPPVITLSATASASPLGVAAPLSRNLSEGLTHNDWGGEIPTSKPAATVNSDGLGDVD